MLSPNLTTRWIEQKTIGVHDLAIAYIDDVVHRMARAWDRDGVTDCMRWVLWGVEVGLEKPFQSCNDVPIKVKPVCDMYQAVTCMECIATEGDPP